MHSMVELVEIVVEIMTITISIIKVITTIITSIIITSDCDGRRRPMKPTLFLLFAEVIRRLHVNRILISLNSLLHLSHNFGKGSGLYATSLAWRRVGRHRHKSRVGRRAARQDQEVPHINLLQRNAQSSRSPLHAWLNGPHRLGPRYLAQNLGWVYLYVVGGRGALTYTSLPRRRHLWRG